MRNELAQPAIGISALLNEIQAGFEELNTCVDDLTGCAAVAATDESRQNLARLLRTLELNVSKITHRLRTEVDEHRQTIQALREAEAAAEFARKAGDVFLANLSHDLRTPLHSILGFAQLLRSDPDLPPVQARRLEIIIRNSEHVQTLIDDVLKASRTKADCMGLQSELFDLRKLLLELYMAFHARLEEKGLRMCLTVDSGVKQTHSGDFIKIRRILENLLCNAIKFTQHGKIELRVERLDGATDNSTELLLFKVKDTGIGIDPTELENLSLPLGRAESGVFDRGTETGLALCRQYVHLMGGELVAERNPDNGSSFSFSCRLQVMDPQTTIASKRPRLGITLKEGNESKLALLIDDDDDLRTLMKEMLEPLGFRVQQAGNGLEGITLFDLERPDVVLLDMRMSVMDGFETTRRIRQRCENTNLPPIIAVTGSTEEPLRREILQCGADHVLFKPFKAKDLYATLALCEGIEFSHAGDTQGANALQSSTGENLPLQLRTELKEATRGGDIARLWEIRDRVNSIDPQLSTIIGKMVARYEYERLLDWVGEC